MEWATDRYGLLGAVRRARKGGVGYRSIWLVRGRTYGEVGWIGLTIELARYY